MYSLHENGGAAESSGPDNDCNSTGYFEIFREIASAVKNAGPDANYAVEPDKNTGAEILVENTGHKKRVLAQIFEGNVTPLPPHAPNFHETLQRVRHEVLNLQK